MKKTLYSLTLSEEVVAAVDALARAQGTNRSALVNKILAEHVGLSTTESRIDEILRRMEQLLLGDRELEPMRSVSGTALALRSSLAYRYRPTVKYSVELFRAHSGAVGELGVSFRSQSPELLAAMESWFRTLAEIEAALLDRSIEYTLAPGRFTRSIRLDGNGCADDAAAAISAYVRLFDTLMKACLAGADRRSLAARYEAWLASGHCAI